MGDTVQLEEEIVDNLTPDELAQMQAQLDKHKNKYVNFLMGQVLKVNKNLDPQQVREMIIRKLDEVSS
jgi:Asp-tRNA(Asn)/Glu-tRNA(Gln) amidotransferase B subunit